jgi:hypothetical protein
MQGTSVCLLAPDAGCWGLHVPDGSCDPSIWPQISPSYMATYMLTHLFAAVVLRPLPPGARWRGCVCRRSCPSMPRGAMWATPARSPSRSGWWTLGSATPTSSTQTSRCTGGWVVSSPTIRLDSAGVAGWVGACVQGRGVGCSSHPWQHLHAEPAADVPQAAQPFPFRMTPTHPHVH